MPDSFPFTDIAVLVVQAICSVLAVRIVARSLVPLIACQSGKKDSIRAVFDLWLPVFLVAPVLGAAAKGGGDIAGVGGVAFSIPAALGLLGVGVAFLRSNPKSNTSGEFSRWVIPAVLCGVVFLLLAAAHRLSLLAGQVAFGVSTILMWLNAPLSQETEQSGESGSPLGMVLLGLLVLAMVEIGCVVVVGEQWLAASGGLIVLQAIVCLGVVSVGAPVDWAGRTAVWCSSLGMMLSVGVLSVATVGRSSLGLLLNDPTPSLHIVSSGVAEGFGYFALEGIIVALIPVLLLGGLSIPASIRRLVGIGCLLGGAVLVGLRLATMGQ